MGCPWRNAGKSSAAPAVRFASARSRHAARRRRQCRPASADVLARHDPAAVIEGPISTSSVELIGGIEPAPAWCLRYSRGKHVVTANKALLGAPRHGDFCGCASRGVMVAFEGRWPAATDHQGAARGIDGQSHRMDRRDHQRHLNFILSEMRATGASFADVAERGHRARLRRGRSHLRHRGHRRRAQADHHVGHRLRHPDAARQGLRRGISKLTREDIRYAEELGYRIKLLGITRRARYGDGEGIELRVHPTLVPKRRLIANVEVR